MPGKLITFEGGEGAGKTTLIAKVNEELHSRFPNILQTRAPGGSNLGKHIRNLLLNKQDFSIGPRSELFLFLADRAEHVDEVIAPALREGKIVLCDRFHDSTVAYQGGARGFGEKLVSDLCIFASNGLLPDLTLYLDIDPRIGLERVKNARNHHDRIEEEKLLFHEKIRKSFHRVAEESKDRFRILDASMPIPEVFSKAMEYINAIL